MYINVLYKSLQWLIQDFQCYYFAFFVAENYMKMKEFRTPGGRPMAPPRIPQRSVKLLVA